MRISASKIKTYHNCSWQYFAQYVVKIPNPPHPKTKSGSIAHKILELLIRPKHYSTYVEEMLSQNYSVFDYPELKRLAIKLLKEIGLPVDKWLSDVELLINAGLRLDFNVEGSLSKFPPEYGFTIKTDKYEANGFIDLAAKFEDRIVIRDYKSQGFKFTDEEMEFNVQALIYQYALYEETGLPVDVEFILLRHNEKQIVKWVGNDGLEGFRSYLEMVTEYLQDFDLKKASSNFAGLDKSKWYKLGCITKFGQIKKNGDPYHLCQAKFPKTILRIRDEKGKVIYSVDKFEEIDWKNFKIDYSIEEFKYKGCKYWFPENYE